MNENQSKNRPLLRELLIFALGELLVLGLMYGVYALLRRLDGPVLLGGAAGAAMAMLNYGLTALGVAMAADKAEQGDVKRAQSTVSLSMALRYVLLIGLLVLGAKSGYCNIIAMVIPLLLARLVIALGEFFRKKDR